jgi:hypothetical protein
MLIRGWTTTKYGLKSPLSVVTAHTTIMSKLLWYTPHMCFMFEMDETTRFTPTNFFILEMS